MTATLPPLTTLTGTVTDASGEPVSGTITAVPVIIPAPGNAPVPTNVTDTSGQVVVAPCGVSRQFSASTAGYFSMPLTSTDTAGLAPSGWAYRLTLQAGTTEVFTVLLPASPSPVDLSALTPVTPGTALTSYIPITGGSVSGTLTLGGSPPLRISTGAVAGNVFTSDSSGNGTWQPAPSPVFNVRNYGALGNGSHDDTSAIQAAANALSAQGGGCLYFPAASGDYKTTGTITLSSYGDGLHVMGDGYGSRIKATGNYDTFYVAAGNGVAFSYMYLDSSVGSNHTDFGSVSRTDSGCVTTSTSTTVTDSHVKTADVGRSVTGSGIPASTTIVSVVASTSFVMSQAATASATVSLTVTDISCVTTSGSAVVLDSAIGTVDVGKTVTGAGIPGGTTILSVVAGTSFTMSANATATASNVQLTIAGSTAGSAINFQTGGTVRMNNMWLYNSFNGISCFNGGGRTEIVGCWIYGRNYGIYTQNPLHILSTGISGDSVGVVSDSCNGSLWMIGCDINGICSLVCRNTLGIGQPNYGITLINVGANYNGGGVYPPEAILPGGTFQPIGFDFGSCYGELRMYACYASGASLRMGGRTDASCGTTSGSPAVTDTAILSTDLGKNVSGPGIPSGTVIQTVTPGVGFTMCQVVPASGNNVLATQAAVNATATASVSLLIGVATQDVEITGGDYGADNSSPVHSIPQAIRIQAGAKIRISGIQCQGAATNSYNGIQLDAPVTGPLSITNCQWTQSTLNCIDASACTTGPFNFSGNQFNGEYASAPINFNATYASQFTFVGNDAGSNIVNGSTLGGSQYDGQISTYAELTSDATGITSTSLANLTALGVPVVSGGTYLIEFAIRYTISASSGNNVGWGISNPSVSYGSCWITVALSGGGNPKAYAGPITLTGNGSATDTGTNGMPLTIKILASFSASGTVYPQLDAGTAGGSTLTPKAGSYAVARRIS
jgi:hypothetical protein